jgi:hypothetical protein
LDCQMAWSFVDFGRGYCFWLGNTEKIACPGVATKWTRLRNVAVRIPKVGNNATLTVYLNMNCSHYSSSFI